MMDLYAKPPVSFQANAPQHPGQERGRPSAHSRPLHQADQMQLRFAGRYSPSAEERRNLISALNGWSANATVLAPRFFTPPEAQNAMIQFLKGDSHPQKALTQTLCEMRARSRNLQALLCPGKTLQSPETYQAEAQAFLEALQEEVKRMHERFQSDLGLGAPELTLMHHWMAASAPGIFAMDFPDAARHLSEVALLCGLIAQRLGGSKTEILQAAMVGWLHDPKFPDDICRENLAAHPVVAAAMAEGILNTPAIQAPLKRILAQPAQVRHFSEGLVEALSINNDSKYVLDNVILKAVSRFVSRPNALIKRAQERLQATGGDAAPKPLSKAQAEALGNTRMETGLRGLDRAGFRLLAQQAMRQFPALKSKTPLELYADLMLNRKPPGLSQFQWEQLKQTIQQAIQRRPDLLQKATVSNLSLFSHHKEVQKAPIAATALATADPMLLSPHKIVEASAKSTCLDSIQSFLKSFGNNISLLPPESREMGQVWQRDVHMAMLQAAVELTGRALFEKLPPGWQTEPIKKQVERLQGILQEPETWRKPDSGGIDFGAAVPGPPENRSPEALQLVQALREHYKLATLNSPAMFGKKQ